MTMEKKKENLILYRGIAVPKSKAAEVKQNILTNGIRGNEGTQWKFETNDLREKLDQLFNKPDLSLDDTRPPIDKFPVICACGDEIGASYYALMHNKSRKIEETSIVIKFSSSINAVYVDGRDLLYTCFAFINKEDKSLFKLQSELLSRIFGGEIIKYFDKASLSEESSYEIAMCDLACQDLEIVRYHAQNQIIIGGRYKTIFQSAFFVRTPIKARQIISVENAKMQKFIPQVRIDDFIKR
jgi:hypothetical protein